MFSPTNKPSIFVGTNFFLVKMISCSLNPNLVQILCVAAVLQSMIIIVTNSLSIKKFLGSCTS